MILNINIGTGVRAWSLDYSSFVDAFLEVKMTNVNIPAAPGIGGCEPLVIGTAMKLVFHH